MTKSDVALCCYNDANTLERSIESVIAQGCLGILFIVDDGSTDATASILQTYNKKEKIKVITNERNRGLAYSLNKIIELSEAEYLARIDADDIMKPNRLKLQISYLEKNTDVIVLGSNASVIQGYQNRDTDLPLTSRHVMSKLYLFNCVLHPTVMLRRQTIKEIGGYNVDFRRCQDYELWLRLASMNYKIENLEEVTTQIEVRANKSWINILHELISLGKISVRHRKIKLLFFTFYSLLYNIKNKIL